MSMSSTFLPPGLMGWLCDLVNQLQPGLLEPSILQRVGALEVTGWTEDGRA